MYNEKFRIYNYGISNCALYIVNYKFHLTLARSSSGLGHRPLKAGITGSNPVRATNISGQFVRFLYFVLYEKI